MRGIARLKAQAGRVRRATRASVPPESPAAPGAADVTATRRQLRRMRNRLDEVVAALDQQRMDGAGQAEALMRTEHLAIEMVQGVHPRRNKGVDQTVQHMLRLQYEDRIAAGRPLPALADVEARFYSQNGEDGIIQLLLAAVGTDTKRAVEICAGDGIENNTANLIVNHGWSALLVDGAPDLLETGRLFYENNTETWYAPPTLRQAWITRDSVNEIVRADGFDGDIDLLTIDVDGNDYWIWEALTCVNPRIVVTEVNTWWPEDVAKTVPYAEDFVWTKGSPHFGASLAAMVKLAQRKGYRLVGVSRYGFNAFFVRNGLATDVLPTVEPTSIAPHPVTVRQRGSGYDMTQHEWVDV